MDIKIIVAVSKNGFMDIPGVQMSKEDREFLRSKIKGEAVIISRGTYVNALKFRGGKPFDCSEIIVITTKENLSFPRCRTGGSLRKGLSLLQNREKVMVLGGQKLYSEALALPETSTIYLTEIDVEYDGKVKFPEFDCSYFKLIHSDSHDNAKPPVTFKIFKRSCPLCLSHPRKFFGNPVKEEVFWDFYQHRGRYIAIYKKGHTHVIMSREESQELDSFVAWLKFEHREGWKTPWRTLGFDHAHVFFNWRAVAPN
ncbi:hypothetical protein A3I27_04780 [Candidatus Giovannonibacteria bacterium RIFCSPLOWO2_02_FULL_43_11b]|nr:MAG: hypothetical protein A3B97_00515 [Candidatus Giovannonibacteria bacterium RIFCSPHIGHO2_02_FULL_43_32]OGF90338.1 MAG: hypothetical protein A3I27_04780 [Candidatus Giovannonibacteria bacterium RIFCSPLOWO2_02_FULL_43_11b]OGF92199.1 MAG: hypothetical protein A3H04_01760 [Candidatus Giovannonibacteria bacterium RIFCSPLOWO2_12_FULL_43_11c]